MSPINRQTIRTIVSGSAANIRFDATDMVRRRRRLTIGVVYWRISGNAIRTAVAEAVIRIAAWANGLIISQRYSTGRIARINPELRILIIRIIRAICVVGVAVAVIII
jgi:hypothetical protein